MSEFVNYLHEVFEQFGVIHSRKMFGGHGIYHNELMFALVADDELYLKADDQSIAEFEELGLTPFAMTNKHGKVMTMRYYHAPEDIYDDSELARHWAQLGYDAALRAQQAKSKKKTARRKK